MQTWLSWSSGKDSAWCLEVLRRGGEHEVTGLFTTVNAAFDRVAMHAVRRSLLEAQARASGVELHVIDIPYPCPNADYERIMGAFVAKARERSVEAMAFGDFLTQLEASPPHVFTINWIADYPSPHSIYGLLLEPGAASNFGRWNDVAQREPVQVVKHGRESSYLISADAYHELLSSYRRRTLVRDLDASELALLAQAEIAPEDRYEIAKSDDGQPDISR